MDARSNHFPGLNGLRAIAAIAVVLAHIGIALQKFNLNALLYKNQNEDKSNWNILGSHSVSIFFVLSGFLITWLLLKERKQFRTVDIKKFYVRRVLRIWPLYYLYLIIVILVTTESNAPLNLKSFLLYIFFAPNIPFIIGPRIQLLVHYWSLGVEEQFYIFWPWLNAKARSIVQWAVALIIIFILTRVTLHLFYPNSMFEKFLRITRFHCMMIGAVGASFYTQQHPVFLKLIDNKITQLISWILLILIAFNQLQFIRLFDAEILSVASLFIIIGQIKIKNRIINLETSTLHFLGGISYGIYIFHPLVIFLFTKIFNQLSIHNALKYLLVYSSIIATTILAAYLSYTFFEKYFLKLKMKFEVVTSSTN